MRHVCRLLSFVLSGTIGLFRASDTTPNERVPSLRSSIGMILFLAVSYYAFCASAAYVDGLTHMAYDSPADAAATNAVGDQAR